MGMNRSGDINQRAKSIVDIATGEEKDSYTHTPKNPVSVAVGRLGGKKGGAARAKALTPKRRSEIAKKAAAARWGKKDI